MPEIFKFGGYSYFYYSREHEPIHVHVEEETAVMPSLISSTKSSC